MKKIKETLSNKGNLYTIIAIIICCAILASTPLFASKNDEGKIEIPTTMHMDKESISLKEHEKVSEIKHIAFKKIKEIKKRAFS